MELIKDRWGFQNSDLIDVNQSEEREIEVLLLGHKVEKVADDHLLMDDGTLLRIVPNEGGCSCSAGDYDLTELNGTDNIITSVEVVDEQMGGWEEAHSYKVFVYAENKQLLFQVDGDDGNGYYGTGYSILVRKAK